MAEQVLGMAWYYREQWDRIREVSDDRNGMHPDYNDWLKDAQDVEKEWKSKGVTVHKVYIDVNALVAWAARKGLNINGNTRSNYVNHLLAYNLGVNKDI